MKEFRTELIPKISSSPMGLKDQIFTIGSCFADEIGKHLRENKFTVGNYFGTVYNPISIHRLLLFGLNEKYPSEESFSKSDDLHFNYHFHSFFSALSKNEVELKIKKAIDDAHSFLKNANRIIITYGTAFVYRLKSNDEIVANCHKVPSSNFSKSLLTESKIVESFQNLYSKLKLLNPTCKIILTVSPVRHLKDTLELNSVSKSVLRLSCHSIENKFDNVEYFPAYEILLDDLRDYRFYKTDRLHPTDEAVEYIWEKFVSANFNAPTKAFISDWQKIKNDLAHKPFNVQSESHQKFLNVLLNKLEKLNSTIDMSNEIQNIKLQIIK